MKSPNMANWVKKCCPSILKAACGFSQTARGQLMSMVSCQHLWWDPADESHSSFVTGVGTRYQGNAFAFLDGIPQIPGFSEERSSTG